MLTLLVSVLTVCIHATVVVSSELPIAYRWVFRAPYSVLNSSDVDTGKGSRYGAVNCNTSVVAPGTPNLKYAHAPMLERLPNGSLAAAWQASPDFWEGSRQQGIYWAVSNDHGNTWSTARQLAAPQNDLPVWAPVLFSEGPRVHLFFSGPTNSPCKFETGESGSGTHWAPGGSIQMMTSHDGGATWSMPREIYPYSYENGVAKMLANRVVVTQKGTWLIPFWREASAGCQNEQWHGQPGVLISRDKGKSWMLSQQFQAEDTSKYGWLIEGSLVAFNHTGGRQAIVQMFRTRTGVTATSMSMTDGVTWSRVGDTPLPNPNSKVSNIGLPDGSLLTALNDSPSGRTPLIISRSTDGGYSWERAAIIEDEPSASFHYPGIFYHPDSEKVFVAYTVGYPAQKITNSSAQGGTHGKKEQWQPTNYGKVTYGIRVAALPALSLVK